MKSVILLLFLMFITSVNAFQIIEDDVTIGLKVKPDASAVLQLESVTKGFLPPRMTSTQRDVITATEALLIYNTTTNQLEYYNASAAWAGIGSGSGGGIAEWVTSTAYIIDDVIFTDDKIYVALTAHTAGTFATDLGNNEWSELSPFLTNAQVKTAYEANADTNAFTDAEQTLLGNQSGTNTGDQDLSTLLTNPLTTTGDIIYSTSGTTAGVLPIGTDGEILTLASGVPTWAAVSGSGDVVGPASSVDNTLPRYDSTTGKLLQGSSVVLSDLDAISGLTSVYVSGSDASVIPFTIRGANQTANFLEVETQDGTNVLEVDSAGVLRTALRSSTSDGFSIAPIGGATNHGIVFNGTGNNSNVTLRAANSAYMTLSGNGVLISGVGVYAIRSGTRGVSTSPAYTFDNDRDTGIFSDSTNLLSMSSGAVVALTTSATEVQAKLPLELANNASATTPPSGEISIHNDSEVLKVTNDTGIERRVSHFEPRDVFTNPSFEDSDIDNGWTITSGTATAELTTIVPSEGEQALELDVSASAFEMYQTFDCSDYDAIPLGFSAYVSATPSSELEICGFDGTTDLNCTSLYTSSTSTAILGYQKVLAENTGGGTCGIKFKSDATITETIHIDGVEFTDAPYRFVDVQNTTEWVSFTPVATGFGTIADAGAVWRRVGDSMEVRASFNFGTPTAVDAEFDIPNGQTIDLSKIEHAEMNFLGTGQYVQTSQTLTQSNWRALVFSDKVDSSAVYFGVSASGSAAGLLDKTDGTGLGLTGQGYTLSFTVPIQGWSATSSNVVTPTKSNLSDWETYVPTFTGFGTVTVSSVKWKRVGDSVQIRGTFTGGTSTGVEARISLPSGLTSDDNISTLEFAQGQLNANATNGRWSAALIEPSVTYLTFSYQEAANAAYFTKANGNAISAGSSHSFYATVPIEGWSGEDYFLSMFPKDRFQTKLLSADVTTTTDISDLQFDNLKIGTVYNIGGIVYATQDSSIEVQAYSAASGGGTNYGIVHYSTQAGTDVIGTGAGVNNTFTAVSTSLFFRVINPFSETVAGDNTNTETHITLTERNTTIETDQF